jgi:hypothetical protein
MPNDDGESKGANTTPSTSNMKEKYYTYHKKIDQINEECQTWQVNKVKALFAEKQ